MPSSVPIVPLPATEADLLADAITHVYGKASWYPGLMQRAGRPAVQLSITPSRKAFMVSFSRLDDKALARTICGQVAALVPSAPSDVVIAANGSVVARCPGRNRSGR